MTIRKMNICIGLPLLSALLVTLLVSFPAHAETMFDAGEEDIIESDNTADPNDVTAASLLGFEDSAKKPEKKYWGNLRDSKDFDTAKYINNHPEAVPVMSEEDLRREEFVGTTTPYKSDPFDDRLKMVEDTLGGSKK